MAGQARTRRPGWGSYGRALTNYLRKYAFLPAYAPEQALRLVTDDGLRLSGARLVGPADAFGVAVLVHGLVHSSRTPGIYAFAHLLARSAHVIVPELRGHGRSEGVSTLGREEPLDVAAAVAHARQVWPGLPVFTVGVSLGGAAVLLHAGTYGGVAGVVAVSSPGWWGAWDTPATQRVQRFAMTRGGRMVMQRALRTRIAPRCDGVPDARDVVASISPAFTLLVHDPADHYFGREHPDTLYAWAREPKALWWEEGKGHGTDLLTADFATRLVEELRRRSMASGGARPLGSDSLPLPRGDLAEQPTQASRLVTTVDGAQARAYAAATNDANPRYASGECVPPLFGVVPTWEALFGTATAAVPAEHLPMLLHAEQDMRFHRPLVAGMTLATSGSVYSVRAIRSGTWLTARVASEDADGAPVLEQFATMFIRGWFGLEDFGPDRPAHKFPDEARNRPVAEVVRHVDDDQTFRYRDASGDTNPIHVDEAYAQQANLPGIIVHGLCTMAMCGSVVVDSVCAGDPTRLARLAVRFSKPVFPGSDLVVSVFDAGAGCVPERNDGCYAFEAVSGGQLVVRDGLAEVRS